MITATIIAATVAGLLSTVCALHWFKRGNRPRFYVFSSQALACLGFLFVQGTP